MFDDIRSKKVIFLSHCILNQNATAPDCAFYPAALKEVIYFCLKENISIKQMPCPELLFLGLDRQRQTGMQPTNAEEKTRVGELVSDYNGSEVCDQIAQVIVYQLEEYIKNGIDVIGIIGINATPSCGADTYWSDGEAREGPGVLIEEISKLMLERGLRIPVKGINMENPQEAVSICESLLNYKQEEKSAL